MCAWCSRLRKHRAAPILAVVSLAPKAHRRAAWHCRDTGAADSRALARGLATP